MAASDPLSITYAALWDMLEDHSGFTDLVKVGNRMKFAGDIRDPSRMNELTNDRPLVGILADEGLPHLQATSNSTFLDIFYHFLIVTGEQRLDEELYPVTWEMFRAMSVWTTRLQALTWQSKPFISLARPVEHSDLLPGEEIKGLLGWSSRWRYEVKMFFTTSDVNP